MDKLVAESECTSPATTTERTPTVHPLTLDFLGWLAACPRSYAETMDAWRTSCPRLSIWEDALADGLVAVARLRGDAGHREIVVLTDAGHDLLSSTRNR